MGRVFGISGFIFLALIAVVSTFSRCWGDEKTKESDEFFERRLSFALETETIRIRLSNVKPGITKKAKLLLHNAGKEAVTFKEVHVGCKCTTANVPETTIRPGDFVECDFVFHIPPHPKKLVETLFARINCDGPSKSVEIRFVAEFDNLACFTASDFTSGFFSSGEAEKVRLPILVSSDEVLARTKVVGTDDFVSIRPRIVEYAKNRYVEFELLPEQRSQEKLSGVIHLYVDKEPVSSILCLFHKNPEIEFFPKSLIFLPGDQPSVYRQANAMLKVRREPGAKIAPGLRTVSCVTVDGKTSVDAELEKVTDQVFRIKVLLKDVELTNRLEQEKNLLWKVSLGNGTVSAVPFSFVFSN